MNLMRDILSGVWMLSENEAQSLLPVVNRFLKGESVDFSSFIITERAYGFKSESSQNQKKVLVIPIKGVITKYDCCGEMGMVSLTNLIKECTNDDNIGAVVFDIDSGGGEASYMVHVAKAIQELRTAKPTITYFSGYCASAAYYIASQTNEIFASTQNDIVGSIGTMVSLMRPNPENKDAEWIYERIYATKSTLKNNDFEEAWKGNPEPVRENILNPLNEEFHEMVRIGRPQLTEEAYSGVSLIASKSMELNMIDGFKSFEEVIQHAFTKI